MIFNLERFLNKEVLIKIKRGRGFKMDWLYVLGGMLFGSGSLYFFVQQAFIVALLSFVIALVLVYYFEISN